LYKLVHNLPELISITTKFEAGGKGGLTWLYV